MSNKRELWKSDDEISDDDVRQSVINQPQTIKDPSGTCLKMQKNFLIRISKNTSTTSTSSGNKQKKSKKKCLETASGMSIIPSYKLPRS